MGNRKRTVEVQTLTVEQAAQALGICRSTAYTAIKTGVIPSIRILGRRLVPKAALDEMLRSAGSKPDNGGVL